MDIEGTVLQFKGERKEPPDGSRMLVPVNPGKCRHLFVTFEVDRSAGVCRCKACGETVSAMFVLEQLMHQESQWLRTRAAYQDEMARLAERSRTKCCNCGQMTRISRG